MPILSSWFKRFREDVSLKYTPPSVYARLAGLHKEHPQDATGQVKEGEDTKATVTPVERDFSPGESLGSIAISPITDLTPDKRQIIWSILSVFETGKPNGDYAACSILKDGAGLSYGKHQATDKSGSLDQICLRYIDKRGIHSEEMKLLLDVLELNLSASAPPGSTPDEVHAKMQSYKMNDPKWTKVVDLMRLLEKIGNEPEMRGAQDEVFAELYWEPCRSQCSAMKLELPLSWCAVYDTCVQSGPGGVARIRKLFGPSPPSGGGDEKTWTKAYLETRKAWIEGFSDPKDPLRESLIRSTKYRANALLAMASAENWNLKTPIQIDRPRALIE